VQIGPYGCFDCGWTEGENLPLIEEPEPRLSLSEIEARLTQDVRLAAFDAAVKAMRSVEGGTIEAWQSRVHHAWLDVILAALGKEP
jgi:hypothetical protein